MTLYYDMQKLGKNENFVETFEKVREVLLTDDRLQYYIDQSEGYLPSGFGKQRSKLVFENPVFRPFSY